MTKKIGNQINEQPIPEIYTNSVQTIISPYEFLLQMGLETQGKVQSICNVRMSPQHAKILASILQQSIENYEKNIGEIKLPKK